MPSKKENEAFNAGQEPIITGPGQSRTKSEEEIESAVIQSIMAKWRNPWARARRPIVQQALLNHAFLNGFQYVRHDGRWLSPIPRRYKNQVRLVNNLIRPTCRTVLSLLTRNKPSIVASPMTDTGTYVDEATGDTANKLLKHLTRITNQTEQNQELWLWLMKGGTAFKRVMWDVDGGPPDEVPVTNRDGLQMYFDREDSTDRDQGEVAELIEMNADDPRFDPQDRFVPLLTPSFPGEVTSRVYSCMEVLADPSVKTLENADKVIIETVRSTDFIRQRFEKGFMVRPETETTILFDTTGGSRFAPTVGMGLPGVTGFTGSASNESLPGRAVLRELFIRPTEVNPLTGKPAPFGVHFVWAGDVALTEPDNPLPYAFTPQAEGMHDVDFDLVQYRWFLESGFWGSPYLSDLIPLQRSLNRRRSQINESINAFVHPKLQTAMGSKIKRSAFTDTAGEHIEYTGAPASYLEPPSIRPYVFNSMDVDIQQFNDVAMLHEAVRQGRPPPQVRTAAGLRFLQEQDNLAFGSTVEIYERQESLFGQKLLDRVKQFYPEERFIEYLGPGNAVESQMFKRAPFFQHRWRVYVQPGSAFPDSRAARVAESNEMLQFAPWMFTDPKTGQPNKELYARMIGRADINDFIQENDESRQAAANEAIQLDQGIPVPVLPFEDHQQHFITHLAYMQSAEFKLKPPEIMQVFMEHLSEHEQQLPQQAQQMDAAAQAMQSQAEAAQQAVERQAGAEAAAKAARDAVAQQNSGQQQGAAPPGAPTQEQPPNQGNPAELIQQLVRQQNGGG